MECFPRNWAALWFKLRILTMPKWDEKTRDGERKSIFLWCCWLFHRSPTCFVLPFKILAKSYLQRCWYGLATDLLRTWYGLDTNLKSLTADSIQKNKKSTLFRQPQKPKAPVTRRDQNPKTKDQQSTQHQTHSRRAQGGCWGSLNGPLRATDADRYSARRSVQ